MDTQQTAAPQPDEHLRHARIVQAGAVALGAYERYVKALADNAPREAVREALLAFNRANLGLEDLLARRGYEFGDHVRLNPPIGPWRGLTGILREGDRSDPRYRFRLVFDEPQPSEYGGKDGLARSCVTDTDSIADIEP